MKKRAAREEWFTWRWSGGRGGERRRQQKSSAAKLINASARLQCSVPLTWRWFSHRVTSHKMRLFTRRANHATVNMPCGYPITSRGKERRFQESLSTDRGGTQKKSRSTITIYPANPQCRLLLNNKNNCRKEWRRFYLFSALEMCINSVMFCVCQLCLITCPAFDCSHLHSRPQCINSPRLASSWLDHCFLSRFVSCCSCQSPVLFKSVFTLVFTLVL